MKNKKNILIALVVLLVIPGAFVLAEGGLVPCGGTGQQACTLCDLMGLGQSLLNLFVKIILFYVALFMIMYAAFLIVTDKNKKQGYDMIKKTLIGVATVLLAWTIVNTLIYVLAPQAVDNNGKSLLKNWNKIDCSDGPSKTDTQPADGTEEVTN
jgi:hypothetical protein